MENFEIKPIKNEVEYKSTLNQLNEYWGAKLNTKEGDILELLLKSIDKYELDNKTLKEFSI